MVCVIIIHERIERGMELKKIICLGITAMMLIFAGTLSFFDEHEIYAQDNSVTEEDPFADVEIVMEENAVPLDPSVSKNLPDAAMGDGMEMPQMYAMERASDPYWKIENGIKSFYNGYGQLMYNKNSKKVIDISSWQGTIDWQKVKNSGIDGAIIRIGWGWGNLDSQALRNISECNRLGIPYGIYLYSYAYDANFAYQEAVSIATLLKKADVNLSFPIYYDIEKFTPYVDLGITRYPPTTTAQYEQIIGTFITQMNKQGYTGKVHVYSYRSMLNDILNSSKIHQYVSWAAEYGPSLKFTNRYYSGVQGWQYTSSGSVPGISGGVDMNCFGDYIFNESFSMTLPSEIQDVFVEHKLNFSGGYVSGFAVGSDFSGLLADLQKIGTITCYNEAGTAVNGGIVKTGLKIRIQPKTRDSEEKYTVGIVVKGDINGDGKISSMDYVLVKNHILNISKVKSSALKASDINRDGRISSMDYVLIKNHILGLSKIEQ